MERIAVGFDETGNTGPNLLDRDQPLYVLASVQLSNDAAADVLRSTTERHFVRDKGSAAGRRRIVESLSSELLTSGTVRYSVVHKSFSTSAKMIDLLVEPVLAAHGIDMYESGMHLGAANLLHLALSALDVRGYKAMQTAFVGMCRQKSERSVGEFYRAVERFEAAVAERHGIQGDPLLTAIRMSRPVAEQSISTSDNNGSMPSDLDPAVTCLVALLHDWVAHCGPIHVEHDDSKEISRSLDVLRQLWRGAADSITVSLWNSEELAYPLGVDAFEFADSRSSNRVQVADLVAGAAREVHALAIGKEETPLAMELRDLPWDDWRSNASIWPSVDDITPERPPSQSPTTPFPADAMAEWLGSRPSLE